MRIKIFAISALFSIVFGSVGALAAQPKRKKASPRKVSELLTMLPASELAMTLDARRLFDEALPQLLASNQPMLAQVFAKLDEIREKTGIDVRQLREIAVGVSAKKTGQKSYAFEPLVLARGKFSAASIISIAKLATGEYREEMIGERTVYVFSAEKMAKDAKSSNGNSVISGILDTVLDGFSRELAVTAIDGETLAIGSLPQMRSMLEAKTRLAPEVSALLSRKAGAIMSVGAIMPDGMSALMDIDNDAFGASLDSIRKLSAALDVASGTTSMSISAKTADLEQAKSLRLQLADLQSLGKVLLGSTKGGDKRVYQRMVESAKITQLGNEVSIDIKVPQTDVDILVAQLK